MAYRRWLVAGCFALCGAVVACGSSTGICDRLLSALNSLTSKAQACVPDAGFAVNFNKANCERELGACNSNDQNLINQQIDCVNNLPNCTPATFQSQWAPSLVACVGNENSISPQCRDGGYF